MDAPAAQPAADRYTVLDAPPRRLRDLAMRWEVILVILLALTIVVNTLVSPYFLDVFNLADATFNFSEKAIIALAMALLILVREIDLSVAAIVALAAMGIGYAAEAGYGPGALFAVGLGIGLLCGAFNGLLVTWLSLPSIVVTIGTMSLFRGLTQVILGDQAKTKYPPEFLELGQSYFIKMKETGISWLFVPPVPLSFLIFILLAVLFGLVLHRTAWPRSSPPARTRRRRGFPAFRSTGCVSCLPGLRPAFRLAAALLTARSVCVPISVSAGSRHRYHGHPRRRADRRRRRLHLGVFLAVLVLSPSPFGMSLNNIPGQVVSVYIGYC